MSKGGVADRAKETLGLGSTEQSQPAGAGDRLQEQQRSRLVGVAPVPASQLDPTDLRTRGLNEFRVTI